MQVIIEEYPEEIALDTCYYWNLIEFIKLVHAFNNQYSRNILLIAKQKFDEFSKNDVYTFDFDRNIKNEIKSISDYLSTNAAAAFTSPADLAKRAWNSPGSATHSCLSASK